MTQKLAKMWKKKFGFHLRVITIHDVKPSTDFSHSYSKQPMSTDGCKQARAVHRKSHINPWLSRLFLMQLTLGLNGLKGQR